jgi:hypothetical protein
MHPGELLHVEAVDYRQIIDERIQEVGCSNIEERRAAARAWYDYQECCLIMSVQGDRAVADKMQGGDFDGDDCIVIWDPLFLDGFKHVDAPIYSDPVPDPLGSSLMSDYRTAAERDEKLWEWWETLLRRQGTKEQPMVLSDCSTYHASWADMAASAGTDWTATAEGRNAIKLGDIAHKAVDAVRSLFAGVYNPVWFPDSVMMRRPQDSSGYQVSIPAPLKKVQRPRYCLGSPDDEHKVWCGYFYHNVTPSDLCRTFQNLGYESASRAWVSNNNSAGGKCYGFVYFDQHECTRVLELKAFKLRGASVRIGPDTTKSTQAKDARAESEGTIGSLLDSTTS